jgi:hypothetical protein
MAISKFLQLSLGLLATVTVNATPLQTRGIINHDSVVGLTETVPYGAIGALYKAYQPFLYVADGCVPFPAVNAAGDTRYALCPPKSVVDV